jgi:thiol-disulfide isomerase/thioredoxin
VDRTEPLRDRTGRLTLIFLIVVLAGLGIGVALRAPAQPDPLIGTAAGEVVVDQFDGGRWILSRHLASDGRPVFLNLWASYCEPCKEEIPTLSAFAEAHPEITVVGVAVSDEPGPAKALATSLEPSYPIGIDPTGLLIDRYPSIGIPTTFLIDRQGIIRAKLLGGLTAEELESTLGDLSQ